jgi:riboflavin transporter
MNNRLRKILLAALFCAMAVVGANIKIAGSIAFDSLPAFLAAMLMGGTYGAIIGSVGHMVSALLAGFPLTLPLHIVVAVEMAAICFVTGQIARKGGKMVILAAVTAFVLNAFVSPAVLIFWPGMGFTAYLGLLAPLGLASFANVFIATIVYYPLKKPYEIITNHKK